MQGYTDKYTPMVGEGHITILPWHYSAITQGTWVWAASASDFYYGVFYNSTIKNADQIDYKIYLDAGTYTSIILTRTGPDMAIYDFLLDTASQGTIDCYAVGWTYNVIKSLANIVVASAGLKTLSIKANGKSGANYYVELQSISFYRTA